MDLFTLGTPVIDFFARCSEESLRKMGLAKGATNYFSEDGFRKVMRGFAGKILHTYPGDNGRNVCEGFSALGGFCGYQGAVGTDREGAMFSANLAQCGIADFLEEKKGKTGKILALITPDGERTFCAYLGVAAEASEENFFALEMSKFFFTTSIMLCGGNSASELTEKYLEAAKKKRLHISIAVESAPMVEKNRERIALAAKKYASSLLMNESEAEALFGPMPEKKLLAFKPKIPIYLKAGPKGSVLFWNKKAFKIGPLPAKVVDTTGAGDAYAAGVLYGISRNYSFESSGKLGCMLATKVVQKIGSSIPHSHIRIRIRHEHGRAAKA
jgi:sugar/nucleoside kinase (ribokinase family)